MLLLYVLYFLYIPLNQKRWCQNQTVCCNLVDPEVPVAPGVPG